MPNALAYLALCLSPAAVYILFRILPLPYAFAASILGGYMFLPGRPVLDLPLLPPIDKDLLPVLFACLFGSLAIRRLRTEEVRSRRLGREPVQVPLVLDGWIPKSWIARALLLLLVIGAFGTALTNRDALRVSETLVLPPLRPYDAFSMVLLAATAILPALAGRRFLADEAAHRAILICLALAGLIYSLPILAEVRLSPQLNTWVYGYFPHSFAQHIRGGGYRPLVFMPHGLWLGIFVAMCILAAAGAWRIREEGPAPQWIAVLAWLALTLVLMKSLGAFLIALALVPLALFVPIRMQMIFAASIAALILLYPLVRSAGLVPMDAILSLANSINPDRAGSLAFRLDNEDVLLAKALERPVFGWGGWGRNAIYSEFSGQTLSVTDGSWIIAIGVGGWVSYIAQFGLLTFSLFALAFGRHSGAVSPATAVVCLILLANLVDMIPNATLTPVTWMVAGALIGRLEALKSQNPVAATDPKTRDTPVRERGARAPARPPSMASPPPSSRYSRSSNGHDAANNGIPASQRRVRRRP